MKPIEKYLPLYIQHLKVFKGYTERTQIAYENELKYIFRQNIFPDKPVTDITVEDIEDVVIFFANNGERKLDAGVVEMLANQKTTYTRKINALRSFFKFLKKKKYITSNILEDFDSPKLEQRKPVIVTQEKLIPVLNYYDQKYEQRLQKLLKKRDGLQKIANLINENEILTDRLQDQLLQIQSQYKLRGVLKVDLVKKISELSHAITDLEFKKMYNTLILRLLYTTMMRVIELQRLRVGDIHFDQIPPFIHVFGKGNKERKIPLVDPITIKGLKDIIDILDLKRDEHIFLTHRREPYKSPSVLERKIKKIREELGLDFKLSPHYFRKAGTTHLSNSGADLLSLQEVLGHSSPNTTKIYVSTDFQRVSSNLKEHNPFDKLSE